MGAERRYRRELDRWRQADRREGEEGRGWYGVGMIDTRGFRDADEIERMSTTWTEDDAVTSTRGIGRRSVEVDWVWIDHHESYWTFNPPEEPRPRPVSDFVPRCRPTARPRQRAISPRKNRARSRPGWKRAARRAA